MAFNVLTADGLAIEDHFCNEETPDLSALLAAVRDATVAAMKGKPADRLGCRVLDKDGDDETEIAYGDGYAEWRAINRARTLAEHFPSLAPLTVTDADGVTLHTIPSEAK